MCGGWVSTPKHSIACSCRLSGSWVASRVQGHLSRVNEDCHPLVTVLWQSPENRRPSPPPPPLAMGRGPASQHLPCFLPRHTALLPNSSISPSLCGSGALPGLPLRAALSCLSAPCAADQPGCVHGGCMPSSFSERSRQCRPAGGQQTQGRAAESAAESSKGQRALTALLAGECPIRHLSIDQLRTTPRGGTDELAAGSMQRAKMDGRHGGRSLAD